MGYAGKIIVVFYHVRNGIPIYAVDDDFNDNDGNGQEYGEPCPEPDSLFLAA